MKVAREISVRVRLLACGIERNRHGLLLWSAGCDFCADVGANRATAGAFLQWHGFSRRYYAGPAAFASASFAAASIARLWCCRLDGELSCDRLIALFECLPVRSISLSHLRLMVAARHEGFVCAIGAGHL